MKFNFIIKGPEEYLKNKEVYNKYGIEIQNFTKPSLRIKDMDVIIEGYEKVLKNFRGTLALHGPFIDLNPVSPDLDIRKITREKYSKIIEIAKRLSADYVVFHSQLMANYLAKGVREAIITENVKFWKDFLNENQEYKGTILIENVFERDPYDLYTLLSEVDRSNFRLNLDIGHINLSKLKLDRWVEVLKDYISYSHIHSNNGQYDEHKPIDKVDFHNYLEILSNYSLDPVLTLEYKVMDPLKTVKDMLK